MAPKALPSSEALRQLLRYEPETGKLFWLPRASHHVTTSDIRGAAWAASAFNAVWAGKEAFTYKDRRGYRHGKVCGTNYQAHRIIWKMVRGIDPKQIDHINGNPSDNRIDNLRACTNAQNSCNYQKLGCGSSQYRGVCWVRRDQKWAACISDGQGGKVSLGHFDDETLAAKAYDNAARKRHGEFATLNFHGGYDAKLCN